jgi:WXXGXW repeat (2 copies)
MKSMKYVFLFSFFTFLAGESQAQLVSIRIGRPEPPPPPRHAYHRSTCPGSDYVWHDGRWSWDDYVRDYVWSAGYWERLPPPPRCDDRDYRNDRGRYKNEPRGHAYGHQKKRR